MVLNTTRNRVTLEIQDNDIALEVAKQIILQLSVYSYMTCNNVNLSPHKSATILILDNDSKLKLSAHTGCNTSCLYYTGQGYFGSFSSLIWSGHAPLLFITQKLSKSIDVTVRLTSTSGTVAEGESYQQCVALSHQIARSLTVLLHIQSDTADLSKRQAFNWK